MISIHAPREGSDRRKAGVRGAGAYFNPRSPRGERRSSHTGCMSGRPISIHAPREGSDASPGERSEIQSISIHAPREGSDTKKRTKKPLRKISIHAPREGSDQ